MVWPRGSMKLTTAVMMVTTTMMGMTMTTAMMSGRP
jgi:hypothetical protein